MMRTTSPAVLAICLRLTLALSACGEQGIEDRNRGGVAGDNGDAGSPAPPGTPSER